LDEELMAAEWGRLCEDGFDFICEDGVALLLEKGNCLLGGSCISGDFMGAVLASFGLAVSNAFPLVPTET
jgi:hypothetical protein